LLRAAFVTKAARCEWLVELSAWRTLEIGIDWHELSPVEAPQLAMSRW
jgi:hypothetical protein